MLIVNDHAAAIHALIHLAAMSLVFPFGIACTIALTHMLIDTRWPLTMWKKIFRQTREGDIALHVYIWGDQVTHIAVILVAAMVMCR